MAPDYRITTAQTEHIQLLVGKVREHDAMEFAAMGETPASVLRSALSVSHHAYTAWVGEEVMCIFGIADMSVLGGRGCPWLVGSDLIDKHRRWFLSRCKEALPIISQSYSHLENCVDARNVRAIRWLRWLGFTIHPAAPWGILGEPFHRFEMRCQNV